MASKTICSPPTGICHDRLSSSDGARIILAQDTNVAETHSYADLIIVRNILEITKETKLKTLQILTIMKILSWLVCIGLLAQAGAILFSFRVSISNPEAAKDLYRGLDFYSLRQTNFWHYTSVVSFAVAITIMKLGVWYLVVKTLSKINLTNPFKMSVALKLEKISYTLFGIWLVGILSIAYMKWLVKITGELYEELITGEFLFMACLVFIISQVFKRGVEIQSENELTV